MSQSTKPLIFLEPLSPTLKKLKEVIEENAESEGIELFEIDALEEAVQLIPTIGQSLILTSSPKKCAMMLQQNRRVIKKIQSKTILLSPKAIPRKTLDKFMKVGLTECVVEPVNPKTLLYKVRLQLRSIATKKETEEINSKIGQGDKEEAVDTNSKMRAEKGVIMDGEDEGENQGQKKKQKEENVLEDYHKPKKNNYQEEEISGFYKNKTKKRDDEEEEESEEKKRKGYQEEAIEGHYKGKVDKQEEIEEEEEEKKKRAGLDLEDDLENIKRQVNEEAEEEIAKKQKKKQLEFAEDVENQKKGPSLDIEDDDGSMTQEGPEVEDLGGHYKGEVKKKLEIEEDDPEYRERNQEEVEDLTEKKSKKKLELVDDDEAEDYVQKEEEEEESVAKKKKPSLDLVDDDEKEDYVDEREEDEEEVSGKDKIQLDIEDDNSENKKKTFEEEEYEGAEDKKKKAKAEEIDGYLRGGAAKKKLNLEEDDDLYTDEAEESYEELKKKKRAGLDIVEDNEKDPLLQEEEYAEEFEKKKKKTSLQLEDDIYAKERIENENEDDDDFRKKQAGLQVEDDGFGRKKGAQRNEEDKNGSNRSNARADHIKTHYSSRESVRHDDNDWGDGWEKKKKAQDDFPDAKKEERELIIENEDLGEQTIDYGQLKKEFEGISIDGIPNKKKQYGTFDNVAKVKTYTKKVVNPEGELEDMEFEEIQKTPEEEQETEKVFEPNSVGMEIAVEVLNFYFAQETEPLSLCQYISEQVKKNFSGETVFYTSKKGEELKIFYNGLIENSVGKKPEQPSKEELDSLTRAERKEFENDHKEELSYYEKELEANTMAWKHGPQKRFDQWKEMKTPAWLDHTFQQKENEFVFPFYEGVTLLGLAVFIPKENFNPASSDSLEAIFEVSRGVFLSEYYTEVGTTKQRETLTQAKEEPEKKGGFFSRFFKKGA